MGQGERQLDHVRGLNRLDPGREPAEYLEPLEAAPHQKLRVGPFRLGGRTDRDEQVLYVLRIRKRGGDAYRSDDD